MKKNNLSALTTATHPGHYMKSEHASCVEIDHPDAQAPEMRAVFFSAIHLFHGV